jgi:hypothetical protein
MRTRFFSIRRQNEAEANRSDNNKMCVQNGMRKIENGINSEETTMSSKAPSVQGNEQKKFCNDKKHIRSKSGE